MEPVAWHEPDSYGNVTTYKEWALAHGWKPLYTAPVHASDISQERVDETAKDRLIRIMGTFDLATGHADTMDEALGALESELRDVLGYLRARREWVGLDGDIPGLGLVTEEFYNGMLCAEDILRKRNT
jgi:hypothetical protein